MGQLSQIKEMYPTINKASFPVSILTLRDLEELDNINKIGL